MSKCVTNRELKIEILKSLHNRKMTLKLTRLLHQLVKNISNRGEWKYWSYHEEMRQLAMENVIRAFWRFNPNLPEEYASPANPWDYFQNIIKGSFHQHIAKYKKIGWVKTKDREAALDRPIITRKI